jgi:hypothetical protein
LKLLHISKNWPLSVRFPLTIRARTCGRNFAKFDQREIVQQKTAKTMKKIFKKKFISDLPTLIFSRYETGTTGIFFTPNFSHSAYGENEIDQRPIAMKVVKRKQF